MGIFFLISQANQLIVVLKLEKKSDNRETGPMSNEGHKMTNKVNVKSTHAHKT